MINPFDLQSTLVLIFASIRYKDNSVYNFVKEFARMTATMNPVAVTRYLKQLVGAFVGCWFSKWGASWSCLYLF